MSAWPKIEYKIERHWLDEHGEANWKVVCGSPQIATAIEWLKASSPVAHQGEVMRMYKYEQLEFAGPWESADDGFLEWDGETLDNYDATWAAHVVPLIAS